MKKRAIIIFSGLLILLVSLFYPQAAKSEIAGEIFSNDNFSGYLYKIEKGDNPWKLSKKYYGEESLSGAKRNIMLPNKIKNPRKIPIGLMVFLPKDGLKIATPESPMKKLKSENLALQDKISVLEKNYANLEKQYQGKVRMDTVIFIASMVLFILLAAALVVLIIRAADIREINERLVAIEQRLSDIERRISGIFPGPT